MAKAHRHSSLESLNGPSAILSLITNHTGKFLGAGASGYFAKADAQAGVATLPPSLKTGKV
ncbi:MAG TPA: hypothetical protein VN957_09110 [Chthoniobacterales bacterium]|jgi:hypothetical protein|nr:hypothetical protein [Chthoniobacterales bacterium]